MAFINTNNTIDYWNKSNNSWFNPYDNLPLSGRSMTWNNLNTTAPVNYTLPPEPKLELTSYNPNNQVNSNVVATQTNSPTTTTTNTGSNTLNPYDNPTLVGLTVSQQGFDMSPYTTTQQGMFGRQRAVIDGVGAGNAFMQNNPNIAQAFNMWSLDEQDAFYDLVSQGKLDLNRINNAGQIKSAINSYMSNKANSQWTRQDTLSAIQGGIQGINALANIYFGYKQYKLAKQDQEERLRLQRANYRNQARHMNQQYRDKMAGRGTTVQSANANRALGRMYANRKLDETY